MQIGTFDTACWKFWQGLVRNWLTAAAGSNQGTNERGASRVDKLVAAACIIIIFSHILLLWSLLRTVEYKIIMVIINTIIIMCYFGHFFPHPFLPPPSSCVVIFVCYIC